MSNKDRRRVYSEVKGYGSWTGYIAAYDGVTESHSESNDYDILVIWHSTDCINWTKKYLKAGEYSYSSMARSGDLIVHKDYIIWSNQIREVYAWDLSYVLRSPANSTIDYDKYTYLGYSGYRRYIESIGDYIVIAEGNYYDSSVPDTIGMLKTETGNGSMINGIEYSDNSYMGEWMPLDGRNRLPRSESTFLGIQGGQHGMPKYFVKANSDGTIELINYGGCDDYTSIRRHAVVWDTSDEDNPTPYIVALDFGEYYSHSLFLYDLNGNRLSRSEGYCDDVYSYHDSFLGDLNGNIYFVALDYRGGYPTYDWYMRIPSTGYNFTTHKNDELPVTSFTCGGYTSFDTYKPYDELNGRRSSPDGKCIVSIYNGHGLVSWRCNDGKTDLTSYYLIDDLSTEELYYTGELKVFSY